MCRDIFKCSSLNRNLFLTIHYKSIKSYIPLTKPSQDYNNMESKSLSYELSAMVYLDQVTRSSVPRLSQALTERYYTLKVNAYWWYLQVSTCLGGIHLK